VIVDRELKARPPDRFHGVDFAFKCSHTALHMFSTELGTHRQLCAAYNTKPCTTTL
jgi:hypothetical protein